MFRPVFGGDKTGEDIDAAAIDDEIVITVAVTYAAEFGDFQAAARAAVFGSKLFEAVDAMNDAFELLVVLIRRFVVQKNDGALAAGKKLLERKNFPGGTQRILCQQPDFG
ncbi:MAG: hypothetical protein AB7H77_12375, partial [Bdellovibrionales bacterium]